MPKRTNAFQRLIRRIYKQIALHGATVDESVLLKERDSGTPREVDVLIELPAAGHVLRMAVECRDRARAADVEWIDQLIGKYRDLEVHAIIAVSRSGFTSAARQKAAANKIETRTLVEALDSDWTSTFFNVAIASLLVRLEPLTFQLATEPAWPDARQPIAIDVDGTSTSPDDWLRRALEVMRTQVPDLVRTQLGGDWRALARPERDIQIEWGVSTPNTTFTAASGTQHQLHDVTIRCKVIFGYGWLPVKRELFGSVGIASAVDTTHAGEPIGVMLIQRPGMPPGEAVIFRPDADDE
jgi:hypothetical protein